MPGSDGSMGARRPVEIPVGGATIRGDLVLPGSASAVVVFAHGSGSGRHSPRNRLVADRLGHAGLGTLLLDLLTEAEERVDLRTGRLRFDIRLLADRLVASADWLDTRGDLGPVSLGYFGASTGAGAALVAAAHQGARVGAVVSRGGRPDLAGDALALVWAPTLLVVGSRDEVVLDLNRRAAAQLRCRHRLEVVAGATHLFEEPGALDRVASLAADWFITHVGTQVRPRP